MRRGSQRWWVIAIVLALAVLPQACARTAEERQLDSMREDIDSLQNSRDRSDQNGVGTRSEHSPGSMNSPPPNAANAANLPSSTPPDREVVQVGGQPGSDDYADPEDTQPRPKIHVVGMARSSGRAGRDRDQVEQVQADEGASASSVLDPEAKRAYDAALAQVNAKQYAAALSSLAAFLVKWPDHPYADHALYWRGECYFGLGDFGHAKEQFEGVLARFPAGMKAPDALYKLALCHQKLGHAAEARASFDRLMQDYPQSEAARRMGSAAAGARGDGR
jgi:tol-pal system protein YbgF